MTINDITFPEKIYTYPSMDETDFPCSKVCESSSQQEYIRADLVPTWRTDIENAPKDGTWILTRNSCDQASVLQWHDGRWKDNLDYWCDPNPIKWTFSPVKWMPIPK